MANIRDIRTRIRSVKSTRQITKAMKMVAAAKLRRAQERALASRPYAQMLVNVLQSTMSRADVTDPKTGQPCNPLLAVRPEQNVLLILVTGDRGLAGAFNSNVLKAATKFISYFQDKNIDVLAIGRKGRDFLRRRYPVGKVGETRAGQIQVIGEHLNLLSKVEYERVGIRAPDAHVVADAATVGEVQVDLQAQPLVGHDHLPEEGVAHAPARLGPVAQVVLRTEHPYLPVKVGARCSRNAASASGMSRHRVRRAWPRFSSSQAAA